VLPPEPVLNGQDDLVVELVDAELVGPGRAEDGAVEPARVHVRELARRNPAAAVATAAAVVGTGFVAGAIATAVVSQKVATGRRRRDARRLPPVVGSRRFLVDVHLLGDR
jgi:anti-sigma factor RsiW